ncbi:MAG TPA: PQQ-dependent sugar dehydrogenase, partial [Polyangia bacterium]|nr:PQQ-dependent sugar dehydrogenase [Polyangia bacterium]
MLTTAPGLVDELFVTGVVPTAMEFAPDGRLFFSERPGHIRVVKNGMLLPTAFASMPVDTFGERGLMGIAFDPAFATNHFVYCYYTAIKDL